MHEDHNSGKMLWQKPGMVALKANSFSRQNLLNRRQETEEKLMDCGPTPRVTRTTSSLPRGAWLMYSALP